MKTEREKEQLIHEIDLLLHQAYDSTLDEIYTKLKQIDNVEDFRMGLYLEAELMFRKAISRNPRNWCSLVFLAGCLTQIDKYSQSDKLLAKAASLTNQSDYEALLSHIRL